MKETYLLDTCSLISLKKNYAQGHELHIARLSSLNDNDEVCASILSIYELSAGANHASNIQLENDTRQVIHSIRNEFEILPVPMEQEATEIFGALKELYKDWESPVVKKRKLGNKAINRQSIDLLIATTAIMNKAILVTTDAMGAVIGEFCSSFRSENWMK